MFGAILLINITSGWVNDNREPLVNESMLDESLVDIEICSMSKNSPTVWPLRVEKCGTSVMIFVWQRTMSAKQKNPLLLRKSKRWVFVTLGSLLVSLKGTCPLSVPGPWRIDYVLIGDRSPKCFKVVSLKAGQVRQFTCARLRTEVGNESMIVRDISLSVAARL